MFKQQILQEIDNKYIPFEYGIYPLYIEISLLKAKMSYVCDGQRAYVYL